MEELNAISVEDSIKEDKRWCVYIHRNFFNNKCYIGITSKSPQCRWGNDGKNYKKKKSVFSMALQKYPDWDNDWEHIIFNNQLTEQEAKHMERLLIALYQTNCCKYTNPSYGYNMTDGGDGTVGWKAAEETKRKIGAKTRQRLSDPKNHPRYGKPGLKGENNPMFGISPKDRMDDETYQQWYEKYISYRRNNSRKGVPLWNDKLHPCLGRKISDEQKELLKQSAINRYQNKENHPMYGKCHTDDARRKMSDKRNNGQMYCCKPIYCPELNKCFYAASEAEKLLSIDASGIRKCCNGTGGRKSMGKHPETGEPLHWLSAKDAVSQGYITQQELNSYINRIKSKGEVDYED